jgi:hypothetical protein
LFRFSTTSRETRLDARLLRGHVVVERRRILRLLNGNALATDFSETLQSDNQFATAIVDEAA